MEVVKMILVIDTETTGLPDWSLPIDHPLQPHIVELAAWLGDWDEDGELFHVASLNTLIKPDGWAIGGAAQRIHGITNERATALGCPLDEALHRLYGLVDRASSTEGSQLIAHNLRFDNQMLLRESRGFDPSLLNTLQPFCTMIALTPRMRLPSKRPGSYKWPTLAEAHEFCFGHPPEIETRHSAMGDVLSCRDIFLHGRSQGWWR